MNDNINVLLDIQVYEENNATTAYLEEVIKQKVCEALIENFKIYKNISMDKIEVNTVEVNMNTYIVKADLSILDENDNKIIDAFLTWNM